MRKKKNSIFLFTHCSLSHYISLTILSYPLYFSLLFCLLSLIQFFKTPPVLTLWDFTSFLQTFKWPNILSIYFFICSFFLPFTLFTLILLQPISFLQLSLGRMTLTFGFFLFFLPSVCLTRLSQPTPITHADFCT